MNTRPVRDRKPYRAPTLRHHGGAVEQTLAGFIGSHTELWGWSLYRKPGF